MAPNPLQALIELRRREEDDARAAWIAARDHLAAIEREAVRLEDAAVEARKRLDEARLGQISWGRGRAGRRSAAAAEIEARFQIRLRDAVQGAARSAGTYRSGPLAGAQAAERAAAAAHDERRGAREAAERHAAVLAAERAREAGLRAEEDHDDVARAARHNRVRRA